MENLEEFSIPEDALERLRDPEVLRQYVDEGKTFQEIIGYEEQTMVKFYGAARHIFEKGRYYDAANAFTFLTTLNPYVHEYWLGLGMSEQMIEEYESALVAYAMATMTDMGNPIAHYHTGTCYYRLGDNASAIIALELAIEQAAEVEEHAEIKKASEEALTRLKELRK